MFSAISIELFLIGLRSWDLIMVLLLHSLALILLITDKSHFVLDRLRENISIYSTIKILKHGKHLAKNKEKFCITSTRYQ